MTTGDKILPAHHTKHLPVLIYPLPHDNITLELTQSNDGANNGTALWLGAQILTAFLADALPTRRIYSVGCDYMSVVDINILNLHLFVYLWLRHSFHFGDNPFPSPQSNDGPSSNGYNNHGAPPASSISCSQPSSLSRSPRAIDLGSGVGLSAYVFSSRLTRTRGEEYPSLALAAKGWHVLATDIPAVVSSVLRPNILRNTRHLTGSVQVRALDWTVPPEEWVWTNSSVIASRLRDKDERMALSVDADEDLLKPPFDLIVTSDTVYSPELIEPLLRTIKHLLVLSSQSNQKKSHPPVYLALEVRDPPQLASFFSQAKDIWHLSARRIPTPRIRRAMSRTGLDDWKREDWQGVEVWRIHLLDA